MDFQTIALYAIIAFIGWSLLSQHQQAQRPGGPQRSVLEPSVVPRTAPPPAPVGKKGKGKKGKGEPGPKVNGVD